MSDAVGSQASGEAVGEVVQDLGGSGQSESSGTLENKTPPPKTTRLKLSSGEEIDESEILSGLNHVREANKRFQDAAAERRAAVEERARIAQEKAEVEAKVAKLKSDPWGLMSDLGLDPRSLSEEYLLKVLEQELMTPEQRRIAELEQKTKTYEEREAERRAEEERKKQEAKEKEEEELFNQYKEEASKSYEEKMISALSSSILPKSAKTIRRVADKIYQSALAGEEIPVDHAVRLEEAEYTESLLELLDELPPEHIEKLFGDKIMGKIRKHDASKLKNPAPTPKNVPGVAKESKASQKATSYVDPHEFVKELKKKHGVI
jgi:hypothetical protein